MHTAKGTVITCPSILFYSMYDEDILFAWFKAIPSFREAKGFGSELDLFIDTAKVTDDDIANLQAIFKRYKIKKREQLEVFKNERNAHLFKRSRQHEAMRGNPTKENPHKRRGTVIVGKPARFYTPLEAEIVLDHIANLNSVKHVDLEGDTLYISMKRRCISRKDLLSFFGFFERYRFENNHQLQIFRNSKNEYSFGCRPWLEK